SYPTENAMLPDGSLFLRRYEGGRWFIEVFNSSKLYTVSNPQAEDVTTPIVFNNRVMFAELLNGAWHWRTLGAPLTLMRDVQVRHVSSDGKVYFSAKLPGDVAALYVWDGIQTRQIYRGLAGSYIGKVLAMRDDVYFIAPDRTS